MSSAGRGRFRLGPIPHYSTTTPNGTRVSCGGCCLPIPIGCLATVAAVAAPGVIGFLQRRRRARV
jgi:hypothetical protein